jgi:flagellar FliL protein
MFFDRNRRKRFMAGKDVANPSPDHSFRQPEEPEKKGKSKLLFVLLPLIVLLGAGAVFGWYCMNQEKDEAAQTTPQPPSPPPMVSLKPFVVNLADDGDMPRYLKVEFDLELRPGSLVEEVEAKKTELRDAIIVLLTSKRSRDLTSIEGKDRMRDEIITRVNSRLQSATVNRVFFKEFIIQ